jgi:hypothetical protein
MRITILAIITLCLSAGTAPAEVAAVARSAAAPRSAAEAASKRKAHEAAITDCERMWDRGTHMSKRGWSQTCRRVQDRLQQLEVR